MTTIQLQQAAIDWLTVTSFEVSLGWPLFSDIFNSLAGDDPNITQPSKRFQYLGKTLHFDNGQIFIGTGEQRGRHHIMLQASGEICHLVFSRLRGGISETWLKCTRIDLQITAPQPSWWNQWVILEELKSVGFKVGWQESESQEGIELATVYAGRRSSMRFLRIYQKLANRNTLLIRYEVEYKGGKALAISRALARQEYSAEQLLLFHVQQVNLADISKVFEPRLQGIFPPGEPKAIKKDSNTIKWLKEGVYPAFCRVINDHSNGGEIAEIFLAALKNEGYN